MLIFYMYMIYLFDFILWKEKANALNKIVIITLLLLLYSVLYIKSTEWTL